MDIEGRHALVTGAGGGIGRATAAMLARKDAAVIYLADLKEDGLRETAEIVRNFGAEAHARTTDVGNLDDLRQLFSEAEEAGGLDIVHNNAAIVTGPPDFPDNDLERWRKLVEVNVLGVMFGTRLAADGMQRRGATGAIVNTASIRSLDPMPTDPAYAASKAAILMFTRSCINLSEYRIRVNAVCPGTVETPFLAATGGGEKPADWMSRRIEEVKLLNPDDIARAVIAMIEDDSKVGDYIVLENEPA